jgi:hypothetical protein
MRGPTRKAAWVAVFAVAATVLGFTLVTSAGAIDAPTTLTFVMHQVNETGIDVNGNHELDPADGWVSNAQLLQDDVVVGKVISSCQYVKVSRDGMKGVLQCVMTAQLADGQLTSQGRLDLSPDAPAGLAFAITGGTGPYENVRGYWTGEPIENSMDSTVTFFLLP